MTHFFGSQFALSPNRRRLWRDYVVAAASELTPSPASAAPTQKLVETGVVKVLPPSDS